MFNRSLRRGALTLSALLLLLTAPACDPAADATRDADSNGDRDAGAAQQNADEPAQNQNTAKDSLTVADTRESQDDATRNSENTADEGKGKRASKDDADNNADNEPANDQSSDGKTEDDAPPALTHYLGREIATTMHYLGAPWLTRESREREEDSRTMLKELGLKPGMAVCDMGCGNGFYTLPIAEAVGEKGKVLAVDIQVQMLHYLKKRAEKQEIDNIEYILGDLHDPKLPANSCDLILLVDVYHEFSHPVHMLEAMRKALKKDGQIVLVEFRAEDPKVPIKPLHKMSKKQILKELEANGYKLSKSFDKLPWQHMMFFKRESPAPKADDEK